MIVGILKETKAGENRVAMTPAGVEVMVGQGRTVLVESRHCRPRTGASWYAGAPASGPASTSPWGKVIYRRVAEAFDLEYTPVEQLLASGA